jgi:hypothetical protein
MHRMLSAVLVLTVACVGLCSHAVAQDARRATGRHPNILLIIGDDFGVDVTSDMYPD